MAYNIGGLTKRNVATPEDTTKVLEKSINSMQI